MATRSPPRIPPAPRRSYGAVGCAYVLLCGGLLGLAVLSNQDVNAPSAQAAAPQPSVARIQSFPDIHDMCRVTLFNNDTGRYQTGATAPCQNLISKKVALWSIAERAEQFSKAFRASW